ncbi:MAG: glycosyltransferase family 2 protein [Candidatus Micrarchaeia archaeon]
MNKEKKKAYISVVVPTLNEAKNIGQLIKEVKDELDSYGYKYEIIVVDGHSEDKTVEIARSLGAKIMFESKGKGFALRKGLEAAKGDIQISMDADLSHKPNELKLLISGIEIGYDICMGSRFIIGGGTEDMSLFRKFGNKFFVGLVNLFYHTNYTDLCYGYRSFKKGVLEKLNLKENGFGIETEISIKAVKKRLKVIEVPSMEKKRSSGNGKLRTFKDGYVILKTLFENLFD